MPEKPIPASLETERLILGAVLVNSELMHDLRPVLGMEDFATERNRRIWSVMSGLYDGGTPVDAVTVFEALRTRKEDGSVGGLAYINELDTGVPRLPAVGQYAEILRGKTLQRAVLHACQSMIERCHRGQDTPQELIEAMGQIALGLAPKNATGGLQSTGELIEEIGLGSLLAPRRTRGILSPWTWLNNATSGFLAAELWVLAGHTSTGKTSAMLQLATHIARGGKGVAVFSLEVGKQSLFAKACYQISRVDSEKAKRGTLCHQDRDLVRGAAELLRTLPLYLDTQSTTVMAIHAAIRRRKLKSPIDFVIVDYLQLLGNTGRHDTRAQAVGANAWALKMLATDFQVPVLLLSQLSRESNKPGKQRKPELGDLKESGDIENHANGVWFIHRESMEDADLVPVEFMLPKQRDGRRNISTRMMFLPQFQRFDEVQYDDYQK